MSNQFLYTFGKHHISWYWTSRRSIFTKNMSRIVKALYARECQGLPHSSPSNFGLNSLKRKWAPGTKNSPGYNFLFEKMLHSLGVLSQWKFPTTNTWKSIRQFLGKFHFCPQNKNSLLWLCRVLTPSMTKKLKQCYIIQFEKN